MAQHPVLTRHVCPVCGAAATADDQHVCPRCGANMEREKSSPVQEDSPSESDATVRISSPQQHSLQALHSASSQQELVSPGGPLAPQKKYGGSKQSFRKTLLGNMGWSLGLVLLLSVLLSGVMSQNTDPVAQRQANQSKMHLDLLIQHARSLGVPASSLQPTLTQEQQLTTSYTPFDLLSHQSATEYYHNLTRKYQNLSAQVTGTLTSVTQQFQEQAQQDMQRFQTALSTSGTQTLGMTQSFAQQLSQDQFSLSVAQTPSEYAAVSTHVRQALQTLSLMASTSTKLRDVHTTLARMSDAHMDVTAMQLHYENAVQLFNSARHADDFKHLDTQISVQYQQAIGRSLQAFAAISRTQLNELATQIHLLHVYGGETTRYQQRLNADQRAVVQVQTVSDKLNFFKQVDDDIASLHGDLVRGNAHFLVKQFHQEVQSWAKAHPYSDAYDGHTYALDNGYMKAGIGGGLDSDLARSDTIAGFEAVIAEANNAIFNLHLFETDYNDSTPYNQIHATDTHLLSHYKLSKKQVLVVSLAEQAMRVYQNGSLVNSYHVTTGRQELPSLPGVWSVLDRRSPVIFTAAEPKGSPFWFPDTPISYAILYHVGGYFVHDAPWRANFGPGTQFPHQDASGTTAYNFDGSHGCINLQESDAGWVYTHTGWETSIVIY